MIHEIDLIRLRIAPADVFRSELHVLVQLEPGAGAQQDAIIVAEIKAHAGKQVDLVMDRIETDEGRPEAEEALIPRGTLERP